MNRILLIGNGFDLAHGLPTSYREFIADYSNRVGMSLQAPAVYNAPNRYGDEFVETSFFSPDRWYRQYDRPERCRMDSMADVEAYVFRFDRNAVFNYKSPFFAAINRTVATKNWVDIENEYYLFLKKICKDPKTSAYRTPAELDAEFESIRKRLAAYLLNIQNERICEELLVGEIAERMFEPFAMRDISCRDRALFEQALIARAENLGDCLPRLYRNYDRSESRFWIEYQNMTGYLKELGAANDPSDREKIVFPATIDGAKHIAHIRKGSPRVSDYFLWPDRILLLNFNYTRTADLYLSERADFETIHIHGELDKEENPMIFGYGDELDDDYRELSKLNDNAYLKNIKSIRYLETDNYRRLLTFVDSAPFQICIMGHSCGNSDRTLLNTLFEHRNCVSIKPFYHEREDGTDDYIDLVQNISRSFNDMQTMRDRVVNKCYCCPLPQRPRS